MTQRQLLESVEESERTLTEVREDLQMLPEMDEAVKEIMDNMNRLLQQMEEQKKESVNNPKNVSLMFRNFEEQKEMLEETWRAISPLSKGISRFSSSEERTDHPNTPKRKVRCRLKVRTVVAEHRGQKLKMVMLIIVSLIR